MGEGAAAGLRQEAKLNYFLTASGRKTETMKAEEFMKSKKIRRATFSSIRLVSDDDKYHKVCDLMEEFCDIEVESNLREQKLYMIKMMLENDSISRESYNYYYQKFCI